jgi:hypothetical protein
MEPALPRAGAVVSKKRPTAQPLSRRTGGEHDHRNTEGGSEHV